MIISSPGSLKARQLGEHAGRLNISFACPALPIGADDAMAQIETLIATSPTSPTLVGSSLGGFYATWLAQRHGLKAVLVNPCVACHDKLAAYVGQIQKNWHSGEEYRFAAEHAAELDGLRVSVITRPERYLLLAETGDEVLDYREAVAYYAGARQEVLAGGDHGFTRFAEFLPSILAF